MKPSGLLWERGSLCFLILALPGLVAHRRAKWLFDHKHKTSCQTGTPMTPVLEGQLSVITCHFPDDLRYWKLDFGVIRHDLDGFDPLGDLILSCTWDLGKDNPSCIGKGSEQVKLAASGNETTLDIPNTQKEHAGRYSCRYALSWPDEEGHCTLAVAGRSIFCSVPHATVSVGALSTITCHFHSDLSQSREKFHVYRFSDDGSQPIEVAYCTWNVRDANGKPSCVVRPGYHLDTGNIGTNATLEIGSAVEMHSGRYSCRTIPANENVKVIDCSLSVKGKNCKSAYTRF
ncbi:uncharacterized protein [Littorina saxatilis]|uniref:uncharacterized protein n=1 Tax=Littorina saxatilis TaxID=31220 RepID=UPI0038B47C49